MSGPGSPALPLDETLQLEARIVRPTCITEEVRAGLARFAQGARDASPRPPAPPAGETRGGA